MICWKDCTGLEDFECFQRWCREFIVGSGTWSANTYASVTGANLRKGTTFGYDSSIKSGRIKAAVNELLDPKKLAGPSSALSGAIVREARDSVEHPVSVPIIVAFDQTGSMGHVPRLLQKKLAELFSLLLRKGYVEDPQLCVGAYGDLENHETAPIQIGQFESDNRADETLDALYLEGSGGGNGHESAAGIWYYGAVHTATDAWDKRGKRGYLFTVGDETTGGIRKEDWIKYVDPNSTLERDLTPAEVVALTTQRWDVYHVVINNLTAAGQQSVKHYTDLLGSDHVVVLQDESAVCETIALAIGLAEGMIDLDTGLTHLDEIGSGSAKGAVSQALSKFAPGASGSVSVSDAPADLDNADAATRL